LGGRLQEYVASTLVIALAVIVSGCGPKTLSSNEALSQLEDVYKREPFGNVVVSLSHRDGLVLRKCGRSPCLAKFTGSDRVAKAEEHGFITTRIARTEADGFGELMALYDISVTDAGRPYIQFGAKDDSKMNLIFKTRERQPIEVVGVGAPADFMGKRSSAVKYKMAYKLTPLGQVLGESDLRFTTEARFVLYDTGWKLEQK
jgi:hypothetical protein